MEEPAIKGSAIESLVADVARYLEEKEAIPEEIEARLEPDDLALLGLRPVLPGLPATDPHL